MVGGIAREIDCVRKGSIYSKYNTQLVETGSMIRNAMKAKFGPKTEEPPPAPGSTESAVEEVEVIPELTSEEEREAEEQEFIIVKAVNLVRNKFIASGLEGGLCVSSEKFLLEQTWEFEVDSESEQVTDPQFQFRDEIMKEKLIKKAINGCVGKMIGMLKRKANTWKNVPFKDGGSISACATVSVAIFSFGFEVSASIPTILECARRAEAEKEAAAGK